MPGGPQVPGHLPGTVERRLQELAVDQRHQGEVLGALAPSLMVIARSADRDEPALTGNRQAGVVGPDHRLALLPGSRRSPCSKKSRSTVNSPILACSSLICAASPSGSPRPRPRWKISDAPSSSAFFH